MFYLNAPAFMTVRAFLQRSLFVKGNEILFKMAEDFKNKTIHFEVQKYKICSNLRAYTGNVIHWFEDMGSMMCTWFTCLYKNVTYLKTSKKSLISNNCRHVFVTKFHFILANKYSSFPTSINNFFHLPKSSVILKQFAHDFLTLLSGLILLKHSCLSWKIKHKVHVWKQGISIEI